MTGFVGYGRLQDAEWLMRACMILNEDRPAHADPIREDTPLNVVYARQSAEFETVLDRIDPERDIDRARFPAMAFFAASEEWPVDMILAAASAVLIWLFLPNWYGLSKLLAWLAVGAFVAVRYLQARRRRERGRAAMIRLGLDPQRDHPLTLRMLVKYRRRPETLH